MKVARFLTVAFFVAISVSAQEKKFNPYEIESVFFNENQVACQKYCAEDTECSECRKSNFCRIKQEKIKTFSGPGNNYSACKPKKSENWEACQKFCKENYKCSHCYPTMNCGVAFSRMKSFRGTGTNWYACEKIRAMNAIWPRKLKVEKRHKYLVVATGGFGGMLGHDGIEWFCEKYLTPEIAPEALCIGSYGRPRMATWLFSENIKNAIMLMTEVTGVKPKIIMVGKSMGACKLHHAVAGEKGGSRGGLENISIDMFIGIDMSCQVKRHYDNPGDILLFRQNIKEFYNFYQNHEDTSQTGHRAYFLGKEFDESIHIDVNNDNFDVEGSKKVKKAEKPLCKDAKHLTIDECEPLLETIQKIILKKMGK